MNLGDTIPRINTIAILLILVFILNIVATPLMTPYLIAIFDTAEYGAYTTSTTYAAIIKATLGALLNIIIAIWTYREAKKQQERPLTWTVFALFFGLIAVVAFYLVLLIKELKTIKHKLGQADNK